MIEKAIWLHLRVNSPRGPLSVEDLCDLPLTELNAIAKSLHKEVKTSEEEDFLEEKGSEERLTKLRFDVVVHILKTKQAKNKERKEAADRKAQKDRILEILAKKEDSSLESKTKEELRKMLEE